MKTADRIFGWLLLVGACGHTAGTILWLPFLSGIFVWSLGSSVGIATLAAVNLLRVERPGDRPLAAIAAAGTALMGLVSVAFGLSIGNLADSRAVFHIVVCGALVFFSVRALRPVTESRSPDSAYSAGRSA